ncbi:epoxyqueuosine reductase QueH [Desulfosediminicola flagellatus]|uniref:epoxyqueuosine reductase QueH n=1 Tax=Desulfosediminicola flagellatus TaxID=2569541 RepID=UPI0010AD3F74|nr:epoxyqueuosine reductase QueH [Desulfosediminicola flagellatus]
MKILLHTCCGPCSIYPIEELSKEYAVSAYFFNPNIHPFQEFKRRKNSLREYCEKNRIPIIDLGSYGMKEFLRKVVFHENTRCNVCYSWRMEETAKRAAEDGFEAFTTTLLYSRYQNHDKLRQCGTELAEKYGISFIYKDFREGWQYGIDKSIELGMYRQPYCGCIYSEQERYDKLLRKKNNTTK